MRCIVDMLTPHATYMRVVVALMRQCQQQVWSCTFLHMHFAAQYSEKGNRGTQARGRKPYMRALL